MVKFHRLEQGSPEWHKMRAEHLGASDVPIALSHSKYKTRKQLAKEKRNPKTHDDKATYPMLMGSALEDIVRDWASQHLNITFNPCVITNDRWPWLMASLDGLSQDGKSVLEIKCNGKDGHSHALVKGVPRSDHVLQVQTQLLLSELDHAYYVSFNHDYEPGKQYVVLQVKANKHIQDIIVKETSKFWMALKGGYEIDNIAKVDLTEPVEEIQDVDWNDLRQEFIEAQGEYKAAEQRLHFARDAIDEALKKQKRDGYEDEFFRIERVRRRGTIDWDAYRERCTGPDPELFRKPETESIRISLK